MVLSSNNNICIIFSKKFKNQNFQLNFLILFDFYNGSSNFIYIKLDFGLCVKKRPWLVVGFRA